MAIAGFAPADPADPNLPGGLSMTPTTRLRRLGLAAGLTAAVPCLATGAERSSQPRVACPAQAPADWRLAGPAPLEQAAVLSQPRGQPIDEAAPPSLVPDRGFAHGNVWHNIWLMGDDPGWVHFVDCRYRGSQRVLRLKADGLRQCEQTAQPYSRAHGVAEDAIQTMACD
jgi:hypothetical protein